MERLVLVTPTTSESDKYKYINLVEPSAGLDIGVLVTRVIDILLFVAGVAAIIYLIYSGILYITAAGNPDAVKKGQQGILNAAIGIAIIVLAFFIAKGVSDYVYTATSGT